MAKDTFMARDDCRWFLGEKPCRFKRLCQGCPEYSPFNYTILVIKLAALGDVMRTTCLLPTLAKRHQQAQITWVTDPAAAPLLKCSPGIHHVLPYDFDSVLPVLGRSYDLALCLDKEPRAIGLMEQVSAGEKRGFGMTRWGSLRSLNPGADYAFRLGLDDELKFRQNGLTYQQIVHKAVEMGEPQEGYAFQAPEPALGFARDFMAQRGLEPGRTVGVFTGAGPVFAHKAWLPERFAALADWLRDDMGLSPLLLGGPAEKELNRRIASLCQGPVADSKGEHDLIQFAGLAGSLAMMITSDSLAMHLALCQKVPSVVLFGSTCTQEIMLTAPGRLLSAGLDCQPCYRGSCDKDEHCMRALGLGEVKRAVREVWEESGR